MPKEYRKLVFSKDELTMAITEFGTATGKILPRDEVIAVDFTGVPKKPVRMEYTTDIQNGSSELNLSRDQLAAALISFCRNHHIALPRSAKKNLKLDGNEIYLYVHVPE